LLKALEADPLAVLGPALPEPARGVLQVLRGHGTPVLLGAAAADLTGAAHPATFRTVPSAATLMARFVRWLHEEGKPGRIAILWGGHDPYRISRDAFVHEAKQRGLEIVAEWVTPGLDPAADAARLLKAAPDSLMLLVPGRVAGRAMAQAARQATPVRMLGCTNLVDPRTLALAGTGGADGARAHVLLPPEPDSGLPAGFLGRYAAANKHPPDELAIAGYLAVALLKAAIDKAGSADPKTLPDALHTLAATGAAEPMLLGDCTWNANSDPERDSYVVEVRAGMPRTVATLRA
jgi:branched-chain amino acid transport system substrate-binding protein